MNIDNGTERNMASWEKDEKPIGNGPRPQQTDMPISYEAILQRVDTVIGSTNYIKESLDNLHSIIVEGLDDGEDAIHMAETFVGIIKSREETNQQALRLLEKMYETAKTNY